LPELWKFIKWFTFFRTRCTIIYNINIRWSGQFHQKSRNRTVWIVKKELGQWQGRRYWRLEWRCLVDWTKNCASNPQCADNSNTDHSLIYYLLLLANINPQYKSHRRLIGSIWWQRGSFISDSGPFWSNIWATTSLLETVGDRGREEWGDRDIHTHRYRYTHRYKHRYTRISDEQYRPNCKTASLNSAWHSANK